MDDLKRHVFGHKQLCDSHRNQAPELPMFSAGLSTAMIAIIAITPTIVCFFIHLVFLVHELSIDTD